MRLDWLDRYMNSSWKFPSRARRTPSNLCPFVGSIVWMVTGSEPVSVSRRHFLEILLVDRTRGILRRRRLL